MGTNYYLEFHDDNSGELHELHIGKSSAGWCFALHVIPQLELNSLDDWKNFWADKRIYNEYGDKLSSDEMLNKITNRSWPKTRDTWGRTELLLHGVSSLEEFYKLNHAQEGPNNLLRSVISDESRCVGHGSGTWDLIQGYFR